MCFVLKILINEHRKARILYSSYYNYISAPIPQNNTNSKINSAASKASGGVVKRKPENNIYDTVHNGKWK